MARQEQSRENEPIKQETQPIQPENKEPSKLDMEFINSISKYFNERIQQNENDPTFQELLEQQKSEIKKLGDSTRVGKIQPKDVCFSFGQMILEMGMNDSTVQDFSELNNETQESYEKTFLDSRKIFMDSCKKIFPDTQAELKASPIQTEMRKIHKINPSVIDSEIDQDYAKEITMTFSQIENYLKENPKKVLEEISNILVEYGGTIQTEARRKLSDFHEEGKADAELSDKGKANAAVLSESLYKLQLVRDELIEKVYGRKDITPIERNEIDQAQKGLD